MSVPTRDEINKQKQRVADAAGGPFWTGAMLFFTYVDMVLDYIDERVDHGHPHEP